MICYDCNLTSICKVFEMTTNMSPSINIVVNDCQVCSNNNVQAMVVPAFTNKPIPRSPNDLLSISDRIKSIEKNHDHTSEAETLDTTGKKQIIECKVCGKKLFKIDSVECACCGRILCDDCITYSIAANNSYCDSCWNTTPAIPLSE